MVRRQGFSVPTFPTFILPMLQESPKNRKKTIMMYSLPPTLNCLNKKITAICRICPQLVHKAHFMSSTWGETESNDTSDESCTKVSSEDSSLEMYSSQSYIDVSKAGSNNSKIKVSWQGVLSHHASVEEAQCKGTYIPSKKIKSISSTNLNSGELHGTALWHDYSWFKGQHDLTG